jgi:hypothetical protein
MCRDARELLGWSLNDLTRASGLPFAKLVLFECGHTGSPEMIRKLITVFQQAGIEFEEDLDRSGTAPSHGRRST